MNIPLIFKKSYVTVFCRFSGWWFQPTWKILVKLDHLPQKGVKIKNIWNHHLVFVSGKTRKSFHHHHLCQKSEHSPTHQQHLEHCQTLVEDRSIRIGGARVVWVRNSQLAAVTPPKSNIDTQNSHGWKEIQLPNHHFWYLCLFCGV